MHRDSPNYSGIRNQTALTRDAQSAGQDYALARLLPPLPLGAHAPVHLAYVSRV